MKPFILIVEEVGRLSGTSSRRRALPPPNPSILPRRRLPVMRSMGFLRVVDFVASSEQRPKFRHTPVSNQMRHWVWARTQHRRILSATTMDERSVFILLCLSGPVYMMRSRRTKTFAMSTRPYGARIGLGYPGGCARGPADRRCRVGRGSRCRVGRVMTNPDRRSNGGFHDPGAGYRRQVRGIARDHASPAKLGVWNRNCPVLLRCRL